MNCTVQDCPRQAKKGGLCWAHIKRRQRGRALNLPVRAYDAWQSLLAAVRAWYESDNDADFARMAKDGRSRIEERLRKAAIRYAVASKRQQAQKPDRLGPGHCPPTNKE